MRNSTAVHDADVAVRALMSNAILEAGPHDDLRARFFPRMRGDLLNNFSFCTPSCAYFCALLFPAFHSFVVLRCRGVADAVNNGWTGDASPANNSSNSSNSRGKAAACICSSNSRYTHM